MSIATDPARPLRWRLCGRSAQLGLLRALWGFDATRRPSCFASAAFSGFAAGVPSPGKSGRIEAGGGGGFGAGAFAVCGVAAAASEAKSRPAGGAIDAAALGAIEGGAMEAGDGATEAGGADGADGVGGT